MYKSQLMDDMQPLSFCMPNEKDESMCSLALLQFLVNLHNQIVQRSEDLFARRAGKKADSEFDLIDADEEETNPDKSSSHEISSRFVTDAHVIKYSVENDVLPFLKDHCRPSLLRKKGGSKIEYDVELLQTYLHDRIFSGKPQIKLEIRMIDFLGESRQSGARKRLKMKIPQEELNAETKHVVIENMRSVENCRQCYKIVEIALNFLQASGGSNVQLLHSALGERLLVDYLENDLLINVMLDTGINVQQQQQAVNTTSVASTSISALFGAAARTLKLKHIDSLLKTLENHLTSDVFSDVNDAYKVPLTEEMRSKLAKAAEDHFELQICLPAIKEFILNNLTEVTIKTTSSLKDTIGWIELDSEQVAGYMKDIDWFESYFPAELEMRHAMHAYEVLVSVQHIRQKM